MKNIDKIENNDGFVNYINNFVKDFTLNHGYKFISQTKVGKYLIKYNIKNDISINQEDEKNTIDIKITDKNDYKIIINNDELCTIVDGEARFIKIINFLGDAGEAMYKDKIIKILSSISQSLKVSETKKELEKVL